MHGMPVGLSPAPPGPPALHPALDTHPGFPQKFKRGKCSKCLHEFYEISDTKQLLILVLENLCITACFKLLARKKTSFVTYANCYNVISR